MIYLCIGGQKQKLTFWGNEELHLLFHTSSRVVATLTYFYGSLLLIVNVFDHRLTSDYRLFALNLETILN